MTAIAIAATAPATDKKWRYIVMGGPYPSASMKVIKIVPPTDDPGYTTRGDTLDLSAIFPHRIYWLMFMNANVRWTAAFVQIGYEPGTAKTDKAGGYSPTDGKIVLTTGTSGTEFTDDAAAEGYVAYAVVSGC